jgi:dihydrofolate reductase
MEEGFTKGGWQLPYFDADAGKIMETAWPRRKPCCSAARPQIFAGYWPTTADDPTARQMNSMPKYVASKTLKKLDWNNSTLIGKDLAQDVAKLKQDGSGVISVVGSGVLAQSLMKLGLVDEYSLWIHPLVLGSGKRLFADGVVPANLKLVDSKTTSSGVMILTYQPDRK